MTVTDQYEFTEISAARHEGRTVLPEASRADFLRHLQGERVESQYDFAGHGKPSWRSPNGKMPLSPGMGLQTIVEEFGIRPVTAVSYDSAWIAHDTSGEPGYFGDFSCTYTVLGVRTRTQALYFLDGGVRITPVLIEKLPERVGLILGRCQVCSEQVERRDDVVLHPHSGDTYCGTGDGATALPPEEGNEG